MATFRIALEFSFRKSDQLKRRTFLLMAGAAAIRGYYTTSFFFYRVGYGNVGQT